ncbi:VWA domain-containing protein [Alienimonas sp. DA493]|uniref:vWA domain-containing protein n=1 Tax=Alienimonas sp. DA493 TaxID=3373605 RepID=UPI003753FC10
MNAHLTEIVVVLDRSGSMQAMKTEAEGGLATFVAEQKAQEGDARFTLAIFDDRYDVVLDRVDLREAPDRFTLEPRGMTALLDAVGRTIDNVGRALAETPEPERPGAVLFCVVTDGGENASQDYTGDRIKQMVEEQTNKYSWQFTFLGAGPDVFAQGQQMGIDASSGAAFQNLHAALGATSAKMSRMRKAVRAGARGTTLFEANALTPEERAQAEGK